MSVLVAGRAARADDNITVHGFAFGGTGETIFEHTRAALRDPHFGMRFYLAPKVPGTLSPISDPTSADADTRAAAAGGNHLFWDVSFGERAPVVGWYDVHPTRSIRHARGVQLNLDAAAFLLLDFDAQSSAVINTDYRLGLSADVRPWRDGWDRLSLSIGGFHQSTHLGDEYVLSAHTIQAGGPPAANPALPYRANPSYLAFPLTVNVDLAPTSHPEFSARVYVGGSVYAVSAVPAATHPDGRVGVELRYGQPEVIEDVAAPLPPDAKVSKFLESTKQYGFGHAGIDGEAATLTAPAPARGRRLRRGARSYILAYELLAQPKFAHDPAAVGEPVFTTVDGHWLTHHAMAMLMFNLDTRRSTSNAMALSLEYIDGRNQHGQLTEYATVQTGAFAFSYYW
jgi:Protein of unknown function (DUF1207)